MIKRKIKIIATVGPAILDFKVFKEVVEQGANFLRINTAYSTEKQHQTILNHLAKLKKNKVGIIYDVRSNKVLTRLSIVPKNAIVALSFAESKKQVQKAKLFVRGVKIIAKIESKKGLKNFREIIDESWGVMVARGDLGQAVSLEKVPCAQKQLSKAVLKNKKFLIIATEMLLSMVKSSKPTRAEVSDVANAVFEGANAVMLSEETAIGKHPVESVAYMRKIVIEAERCIKNGIGK